MPAFGKRRALGQHFLKDTGIASLIAETAVEEAAKAGCQALLEIGPGKGAITDLLWENIVSRETSIRRFILSERDREFAVNWRTRSQIESVAVKRPGPPMPILEVHEGDFLELPEEQWLETRPLAVASNLPYSAGTAIAVRLARHAEAIPVMVLMFQAEVAQRLRAVPGTKAWGSLSIWIQNRWDVRLLCAVPPRSFAPPPDVNSEVVVLTRREVPRVSVDSSSVQQALWDSLLKASFAHRRKMLRGGLPAGRYRQALELSGIDGTKRAEALDWAEWQRLFQACLECR